MREQLEFYGFEKTGEAYCGYPAIITFSHEIHDVSAKIHVAQRKFWNPKTMPFPYTRRATHLVDIHHADWIVASGFDKSLSLDFRHKSWSEIRNTLVDEMNFRLIACVSKGGNILLLPREFNKKAFRHALGEHFHQHAFLAPLHHK